MEDDKMLVSYSYTQPYYEYIEYVEYNVVPSVVTLTFDTEPSSDPADYRSVATGGGLDIDVDISFSEYNQTFSADGNSVELTMPVTMSGNCYMYFYYQGSLLNFRLRAAVDSSYETPAIFQGLEYSSIP